MVHKLHFQGNLPKTDFLISWLSDQSGCLGLSNYQPKAFFWNFGSCLALRLSLAWTGNLCPLWKERFLDLFDCADSDNYGRAFFRNIWRRFLWTKQPNFTPPGRRRQRRGHLFQMFCKQVPFVLNVLKRTNRKCLQIYIYIEREINIVKYCRYRLVKYCI